MFPNPNYHEAVGPGVRWALKHLPFYGRWYRFLLFWPGCDTGHPCVAAVRPADGQFSKEHLMPVALAYLPEAMIVML